MREVYEWKEFLVGDLFEQERGKEKAPKQVRQGIYPLVNETRENNGIQAYCAPTKVFKGNCLTVSINFATTVFYQEKDFGASVNIAILRNKDFNKNSYLYVATLLKKIHTKYSYADKISKDKLNNETIILPVTPSGAPDFDYMSSYISELETERVSELEAEHVSELEAYLAVTGLDDYELTKEDKEILEEMEKGKVKFGEFKIGDLFNVCSSNKVIFANNTVIYNTQKRGTHPYVTRSVKDNGIRGYIKGMEKELNKGNCLTFAQDTFTTFYQEQDFYTGNKVKILNPQINNFNKKIGLYIAEVINKQCELLSWGVNSDMNYIKSISLYLPVTPSGDPDFSFMSRYIRALEKQTIANVYEGKGKIIEKTKEIIQQDS